MSIIYDALKKAQKTIDLSPKIESPKEVPASPKDKRPQTKPKIKTYLLYVFTACLGLFIANIFFGFLTHLKVSATGQQPKLPRVVREPHLNLSGGVLQQGPASNLESLQSTEPPPSFQVPAVKKGLPASLVLNGIFFSEDEGYALINNQIAKVGDVIDGATVKRINSDEVELESAGSTIKLTTRSR